MVVLPHLTMERVSPAMIAELPALQALRVITLVLLRMIITLSALSTLERHITPITLFSHVFPLVSNAGNDA